MTIFLFLVGLMLIAVGAFEIKYYHKTYRWQATKLEHVEFYLNELRKVDGNYVWDMYIPQAKYEYKISNEKYVGHIITKDKTCVQFSDKEEAKKFMVTLQKKSHVYVNPTDPADSVLIRLYCTSGGSGNTLTV